MFSLIKNAFKGATPWVFLGFWVKTVLKLTVTKMKFFFTFINTCSNIQVTRIKKVITKDKMS